VRFARIHNTFTSTTACDPARGRVVLVARRRIELHALMFAAASEVTRERTRRGARKDDFGTV